MSSRFLTDNAGDFFVGLSIAYVDDERRSDTPGDPFVSIMNQERRLRSRSYLSASWTKNDWAAGVSTSRIGSMNYQSPRWDGKPNTKIDPYYDIGAFVRYDIEDGPNASSLQEAISAMGYETQLKKYFSGINTIYIGDNLEGGSDPRREGIAIGG